MLNLALIPAVTEPTNLSEHKYKNNRRNDQILELEPYKPGSQLKSQRISNQLAYNQDHNKST